MINVFKSNVHSLKSCSFAIKLRFLCEYMMYPEQISINNGKHYLQRHKYCLIIIILHKEYGECKRRAYEEELFIKCVFFSFLSLSYNIILLTLFGLTIYRKTWEKGRFSYDNILIWIDFHTKTISLQCIFWKKTKKKKSNNKMYPKWEPTMLFSEILMYPTVY